MSSAHQAGCDAAEDDPDARHRPQAGERAAGARATVEHVFGDLQHEQVDETPEAPEIRHRQAVKKQRSIVEKLAQIAQVADGFLERKLPVGLRLGFLKGVCEGD